MINISATGIVVYMNDGICNWFTSIIEHSTFYSNMCLQTNIHSNANI